MSVREKAKKRLIKKLSFYLNVSAPGQLPSFSIPNRPFPESFATPWSTYSARSVLPSGRTSAFSRRDGEDALQPSVKDSVMTLDLTCCRLLLPRVQQHPYERLAAPHQLFTWTAPHREHTLDRVPVEETQDRSAPGQVTVQSPRCLE